MPNQTKEGRIKLLSTPIKTPQQQCPYLPSEIQSLSVFWATNIDEVETQELLSNGWRKFGTMNFRPSCPNCQKCTPLRVLVQQFAPTKSQRKISKKNQDIIVSFTELEYQNEYFTLYKKHSKNRFNQENISNEDEFIRSFFEFTGQQFLSLFYLDGKLIAFGVLEKGVDSMSSVYFVYDPDFSDRNLGTFGAIQEIEYARQLGLSHYYLGYWVAECKSLAYKANFSPYETFDWTNRQWRLA